VKPVDQHTFFPYDGRNLEDAILGHGGERRELLAVVEVAVGFVSRR